MPGLDAIAPIIWAKWGGTFLETLRQEALDAPDHLAFAAMNSDLAIRVLLVVCTTSPAQVRVAGEALQLSAATRPVDWRSYSVAELIFRTEKRGGLSHQASNADDGETSLVLCATRPGTVKTLEELFDLSD